MSYSRPSASSADASWDGATTYTRPSHSAADATFPADLFTADGAFTLEFAVSGDGNFTPVADFTAVGAFPLELVPAGQAAHGIAGDGAITLGFSSAGDAAHGVAADEAVTLDFVVAGEALHPRYELRGECRVSGVLVERQVRAYRRDTGELVGDAATVGGRFHVNAGFVQREHYVVPIDLGVDASDWSPPTANRVLSVLAQDA